ncbi:hypothetical protein J6590_100565 [Homalodisca vitripennis]|nr:hypothetical protein J6590_100565 [Homalodisca vitripennis]
MSTSVPVSLKRLRTGEVDPLLTLILPSYMGHRPLQGVNTLEGCETATDALQTINGTILKGKPMVIQYGRQQD